MPASLLSYKHVYALHKYTPLIIGITPIITGVLGFILNSTMQKKECDYG